MKFKILILNKLSIILLVLFSSFQTASNANIEKLLAVTKTKETTQALVKDVLDFYKKKYPNVSVMTWSSIESNINYNDYYKKIKQIYSSNYNDLEIKELIKLYDPKTMDKYTLKTKKVEQKLYDAGMEFGRELSQLIAKRIK